MADGSATLKAPFPWFGGKRRIAARVWEALGDVQSYVEPFAGSAAVLLARPHAPRVETINDADGMVANFWRAVQSAPAEVAHHASWPVIEADLHARHAWLISQRDSLTERLIADPEWCDPRIAGWWVWGACAWIGDGWCTKASRQIPLLGSPGRGIHRSSLSVRVVDAVIASGSRRVVSGDDGVAFDTLEEWIGALSVRLRRVRVASGDFERVLGPSVVRPNKVVGGVYLDPPYSEGNQQYAAGGTGSDVSARARAWCAEHGGDPKLRIVLSGYEGEHNALEALGWSKVAWSTKGGYAGQSGDNTNRERERLWLSPRCERGESRSEPRGLFDAAEVT